VAPRGGARRSSGHEPQNPLVLSKSRAPSGHIGGLLARKCGSAAPGTWQDLWPC
jgi:hypothetical protein